MKEIVLDSEKAKDETPTLGYLKTGDLPKKGITIKATYLGSFTGGKYNSTTHYIKLSEGSINVKNRDGELVKAEAGSKIGLSGTKMLNEKLSLVARNQGVVIQFDGMEEFTTKTGELAREAKYRVFADKAENAVASEENADVDIFAS